jgi:hypothetical protein
MTTRTSTFSSTTTFIDGNNGGSRLLIQISDASCTGGVTAGDVIRYDAINDVYRKSLADNPVNAEVFGVVESVNLDASKNVVIYGSINLPSSTIEDIPVGSTGAGGGEDIYFLSPITEGKLRNTTPIESTQIIKAIYQVAPHGSYTGLIMNYIGYKVPSEINIFTPSSLTPPIGTLSYRINPFYSSVTTVLAESYKEIGTEYLDNSNLEYTEFKNKYGNYFGKRYMCRFEPIALIGTAQGNHPLWSTSSYPASTFAYIDRVDVDQNITSKQINMANKTFDVTDIPFPYDVEYSGPFTVGGVYYLAGESPTFTPIGGVIITEILEDEKVYLPSVENSHKLFKLYDQNNTAYTNSSYIIDTFIKVRSVNVASNLRSLQVDTVNTENFTLNNEDLITTLTDIQNRIEVAETEINK